MISAAPGPSGSRCLPLVVPLQLQLGKIISLNLIIILTNREHSRASNLIFRVGSDGEFTSGSLTFT